MVGAIRKVTKNFQFQIPNYDIAGWGFAVNRNFELIDSLIFSITGISDVQGEWANNTPYAVGDRVIDAQTGGIYQANVAHVSASTGTFAQDRAANPTRWMVLLSPFAFRGTWTGGVEYHLNEFLYSGHRYGVCTKTFISGASYDADVAAGNIITLADLTASVNAAANSASAAAASAVAADASADLAEYYAGQAATFNPANFYTKVEADGRFVHLTGNETIAGNKSFTGVGSFASILTTGANNGIELGPAAVVNTPFIDFHSGGQSTDYDARILASGGGAGTGQGSLSITAGGGLNLLSTNLFGVGATFSNTVNGLNYVATDAFYVRNDGDRYIRFQTAAGVNRGTVVHNNGGGSMQLFTYNASGVFQHAMTFTQDGLMQWTGHNFIIGGAATSVEHRFQTNNTGHSYRFIGINDGQFYLQRSTDRFVGNSTNLLRFDNLNGAIFANHVYGETFQANSSGAGTNFKVGDDAWIGDINVGDTLSIRGQQNFNAGFIRFGANGNSLGTYASALDRLYYGTSFFMQTDGNMYLPIYGDTLYNMFNKKLEVSQSSWQDEVNFPIGHRVLMRSNTVTNRNQTALVFNSTDAYQYVGNSESSKTTQLAGTWRSRGYVDDASGGVGGYDMERVS